MLIPADRLDEVCAAIEKRPTGATFVNIAATLEPTPPMRSLQHWLHTLVHQGKIVRVGKTTATRYQLAVPPAKPLPLVSCEGEAIRRLVERPPAQPIPTAYHREVLESYRPNETTYVPSDLRARTLARGDTTAWRTPGGFVATLVAVVSSILALEDAFDAFGLRSGAAAARAGVRGGATLLARMLQPLTAAEIGSVLRDPVRPGVRPDVQLLRAIRAILPDLGTEPDRTPP